MGNDSSHLTSLHMCTWEMIPHTSPACTCVHGMVMVVAWPYTQVVNSYQDSTHKTTLTTNQYLSLSSSPSSLAVCCQLHLSGPTLQSGHRQGRNTADILYKIPSHHVTKRNHNLNASQACKLLQRGGGGKLEIAQLMEWRENHVCWCKVERVALSRR